ncbi:tetratricopeptide repeat protein [Ruegeria jejuensis]|uniref:tetratricopeptide repeat protein n=1 Tax=Ruegeria jejuensis TaxID=3233338 RepID=UPI00355B3B30
MIVIAATVYLANSDMTRLAAAFASPKTICQSNAVPLEDVVEACTTLIEVEDISPEDEHFFLSERGKAYQRWGQNTRAIADFNQALALQPDNMQNLIWRAYARYDTGDWKTAQQDFTRALKLKPESTDVLGSRAKLLKKRGQNEAALQDYKQIMRLDPDSGQAATDLAALLLMMQDYDQLSDLLNQARHRWPDQSWIHAYDVMLHIMHTGELESARKAVIELTRLAPETYSEPMILAIIHLKIGDKKLGIDYARKHVGQVYETVLDQMSYYDRAKWKVMNLVAEAPDLEVRHRGWFYGTIAETDLARAAYQRYLADGGEWDRRLLLNEMAEAGISVSQGARQGASEQINQAVGAYVDYLSNKGPFKSYQPGTQ